MKKLIIVHCILLLLGHQITHADILKSAGKAITKGAKETGKAFEKAGKELSTAFNWEMNVKNNTPFKIYSAILEVDEKQQFAIGAKTAEWVLTIATAPIGGGGASAAASTAGREVAETAGTIAAREIAETATTVAAREAAEAATTTAAREIAETATTTAAREAAESAATTGARAAARETTETAATTGARAAAREGTETTAQKVGTETAEAAAKPVAKPIPKPKAPRLPGQARAEAQTVEQIGKSDVSRIASVVDSPKAPSSATRGVRFGTEEVQTFAPEQAPSRITQSVTGKAESIPGKSILKPTQQTEVVASRTANISKAERLLGGKPGVQEQAKLNLYQKFAKSPVSKEMTFESWLQKNPQQLADEIARVGVGGKTAIGSAPESAATKEVQKVGTETAETAAERTQSTWKRADPTKKMIWDNPRIAKERTYSTQTKQVLANYKNRGDKFYNEFTSRLDDMWKNSKSKESFDLWFLNNPRKVDSAASEASRSLKSAAQSVGSKPSQEVLSQSTLPRAVMEGSDVAPEGKIIEEAVSSVKPTEIPKAPALPEPKAPSNITKPSASELQQVKLKPAPKQEAPARPQDLLRESLAKRRTAWAPEEEIDEPIEAVTRVATSKPAAPTAIPEAPSGIPAPPALPEAPVAKGPVIRPTQEELASRIGQGLRRVEPTAAPKPAAAKTTSLEDILKGAFAKVPAN